MSTLLKNKGTGMKKVYLALVLLLLMLCGCGRQKQEESGILERWQKQYDLGMQYLTEGNYEEAIVAFATAIEIEPNQALAYVGRGGAYIGSGETDETLTAALADYQKAIELDEQNADAYLGAADVYIRRAEYELAEEILQIGLNKTGDERIQSKLDEIESGTITDSSGNTRSMSMYDENGALMWYHEYTYDRYGRQSGVTAYDETGVQINHVDITYDANGNALQAYSIDMIWGDLTLYICQYDEKGRMVRRDSYPSEENGPVGQYVITEYNEKDQRIRETVYLQDGEMMGYDEYHYNSDGQVIRRDRYDESGIMRSYETCEYDENGNRTVYNSYNSDGALEWSEVSEFDENGYEIKCTRVDGNGNIEYIMEE